MAGADPTCDGQAAAAGARHEAAGAGQSAETDGLFDRRIKFYNEQKSAKLPKNYLTFLKKTNAELANSPYTTQHMSGEERRR